MINNLNYLQKLMLKRFELAATFEAAVTINGKDARSLLGVMSLGLVRGASAEIVSASANGKEAVDALSLLIESAFGEA